MTIMLSMESSPPIQLPFRFFLTGPIFGFLAGIILLISGPEIFSHRYTSGLLTITHLYVLGFLASIMMGAMLQFLPVVIGYNFYKATVTSPIILTLFATGVIALTSGFFFQIKVFFAAASLLLLPAFAIFIFGAFKALLTARHSPTVTSMKLAVFLLLAGVLIGLHLASGYGFASGPDRRLTDIHLLLSGGWVMLLITGVAFVVIPMFQITPEFSDISKKYLPAMLSVIIVIISFVLFLERILRFQTEHLLYFTLLFLLSIFLYVSGIILHLSLSRKRKNVDYHAYFWRLGSLFLIPVIVIFPLHHYLHQFSIVAAILFFYGFAGSIMMGMLIRIAPFLVWLHLSTKTVNAPSMKDVISDREGGILFYMHCISVVLLALSVFEANLIYVSGPLISIESGYLFYLIAKSLKVHHTISKQSLPGFA